MIDESYIYKSVYKSNVLGGGFCGLIPSKWIKFCPQTC